MNYSELYFMHVSRTRSKPVDAEVASPDFIESRLVARGEQTLPASIKAHSIGAPKFDLVLTTKPYLDIYSERVFKVLERNKFTGWSSIPVDMHAGSATRADTHRILVVTGRSGDVDYRLSQRVQRREKRQPDNAAPLKYFIGAMFEADTWDGTDIFFPGKSCWTYVTQRVRDALSEVKISGVEFHRIDTFEISDYGQLNDLHL